MQKAEYIEKDGFVIAAVYHLGATEKAHKLSVHPDGKEMMFVPKKHCEIVRKARDEKRTVVKIPQWAAKFHYQLGGNPKEARG